MQLKTSSVSSGWNKTTTSSRKACIYLTEGRYPENSSSNNKQIIRQKAVKFNMRDGELFYKKSVLGFDRKKVEQKYTLVLLPFYFFDYISTTDRGADPLYKDQGGADANPLCMSLRPNNWPFRLSRGLRHTPVRGLFGRVL